MPEKRTKNAGVTLLMLGSGPDTQDLYALDIETPMSAPIAQDVNWVAGGSIDWSFDGRRIVFVDIVEAVPLADTTYELHTLDFDGTNHRKLTEGFRDLSPFWSSDSSHIIFISNRSGQPEFFAVDAAGDNIRQLTVNSGIYDAPVPSPDRSRIAFVSRHDAANDGASYYHNLFLCVMNADGSDIHCVEAGFYPAWSPTGTQIAFVSDWTIYAMDMDGDNRRQIASTGVVIENLYWSPDGEHIAFISYYQDNRELFLVNADGSNLHRLTVGYSGGPVWSPDGSLLMYRSGSFSDHKLYITDVTRNITSTLHVKGNVGSPLFWR
jgi:TolB protein